MKRTAILSLSAFLFGSALFPHLYLLFFTPFLVLTVLRKSLIQTLWTALIVGAIADLFSSRFPLGCSSCVFTLSLLLCYGQKSYFTEEKAASFFLLSFLFSTLSSLLYFLLEILFFSLPAISFSWILNHFLLLPICDGLYSLGCLFFPVRALLFFRKNS
jgi:rod shape-determining protein MreD